MSKINALCNCLKIRQIWEVVHLALTFPLKPNLSLHLSTQFVDEFMLARSPNTVQQPQRIAISTL
jgi:hypothetical protein